MLSIFPSVPLEFHLQFVIEIYQHYIFHNLKLGVSHSSRKMSAEYFAIKHSSIQTPFWESLAITPNLKYAIAQAFPDDDVPEPSMSAVVATETGDALNHSKLLVVKDLFTKIAAGREETL
jgi:hypothetical protein